MKLEGKTALITGGSSGIGLATARLFLAEGAKVAITGRNKATLDAAVESLGSKNVLAVQADATSAESTEKAVAAVVKAFGKIDVVFANAGSASQLTPLGSTSIDAFDSILRVNVTGSFVTIQAALPHLGGGASVILNGSVHAVLGSPGWSAYAASKAAVRAMTRNLAAELAPRGIRVNQVTPGGTRTPIWSPFAPQGDVAALEKHISRAVPAGRFGDPDEIAKAVLYLASDDSSYVQGAELVIDGGLTGAPSGAPIYRA